MPDNQIQVGAPCHWGIGTTRIDTEPPSIGTGVLVPLEQDVTINRESDPNFFTDGSVIGETFFRKNTNVRMRLYPSGATMDQAKQTNAAVIEPGAEMQVTDNSDPAIAGFFSVIEVGKARRYQEKAYWDLTLRRHGDNTQPPGFGGVRISQRTP